MIDWKTKLIEAFHRCMKLDIVYTCKFTLIERDGHYQFINPESPRCNPLESVLVGEIVKKGVKPVSHIARILGKNESWIKGFWSATNDCGHIHAGKLVNSFNEGKEAGNDPEIRKFLKN